MDEPTVRAAPRKSEAVSNRWHGWPFALLYVGTPIFAAILSVSVGGGLEYFRSPSSFPLKAFWLGTLCLTAALSFAGPAYSGILVGSTQGLRIGIGLARGVVGLVVLLVLIAAVALCLMTLSK